MDSFSSPTAQADIAARGRSFWSACCAGCILFVVALVIGSFVLGRLLLGPGDQKLTALPKNFPSDIQLYRLADADSISYAQGSSRGKMMRFLTAPLTALAKLESNSTSTGSGAARRFADAWSGYSSQLQAMDSVTVTWKGLNVPREDVLAYYADLFKRLGMTTQVVRDEASATDGIVAQRSGAAVELHLTDVPDVPGIDELDMTVQYVNTK